MEADEKTIERMLANLFRKNRQETPTVDCRDEERLAGYLSARLKQREGTEVENHLATCLYCLDVVVAAYESTREGETAVVPQWLIERAKNLVHPSTEREQTFNLVVRLVREMLEVVRTSGHVVLAPAAAAVRRQAASSGQKAVQVEKKLGRFTVRLEVERIEPGLCQVVVSAADENGRPVDGVRLTLSSGGRERASFLTRGGDVIFERLSPGDYTISVAEPGAPAGTIRLNLTQE